MEEARVTVQSGRAEEVNPLQGTCFDDRDDLDFEETLKVSRSFKTYLYLYFLDG